MTRDNLIEAMAKALADTDTIRQPHTNGHIYEASRLAEFMHARCKGVAAAALAAIEAQGLAIVDAKKLEIVLDEAESNNRLGEGEFCYSDECREICRLERVRIDEIRAMVNAGKL